MNTKDKILKYLESPDSEYVSGQMLAENLGLSRTAVWKAIADLRKSGAVIEAVTNRGYHLVRTTPKMSQKSLSEALPELDVYYFDEIDSTNNYCKMLASKGERKNALVVSSKQLKGRGRLGRIFESPDGGIYLSFLLNTNKKVEDNMLVTSAASVAICRAIKKVCDIDTQIKWVNDIYYNSKKLCGILSEGVIDMEAGVIGAIIVGIGINFSTPISMFPVELHDTLTSLYEGENDVPQSITQTMIVESVVKELLNIWDNIENDKSFLDEYRKRSCVIGRYVNLFRNNEKQSGLVLGIDDSAHLLVKEDETGKIIELGTGEVTLRLNNDKNN
ncbi:MAG: biotin--[acetyl-CoA-carboxylase] ligase [Sphaerochaetaceae bacterium]|jgi:BirA family biotin operon repressor/biotin-[acetyl-CoA-carboxylase] ligase|nr:biotin--[acetyl-CoA-carboxylase] ligase [Sphaerochaetaceae bacterium]